MKHIQTWLAVIIFLICAPAFAENTEAGKTFRDCPDCPEMVVIPAGSFNMGAKIDLFQEVVATYRAANPKPRLPEEARKFRVQAEFAVQNKQFDKAAELYGEALGIAPWWPEGYYNRAQILGEIKQYRDAMGEMKRYLLLVPDAPDARAMQDKIYQWESVAEPEPDVDQYQKPIHHVTIAKSFALGKTEVTQAQWRTIMGNNPSQYPNCGDTCPVEDVSWNDAQEFIQKLNAKTGKQYLLPSEAEWEYACRAGGQQEYCGNDHVDSVAWYGAYSNPVGNSAKTTNPVSTKQANDWGLYDMSGNVLEWVEDSWHENYNGAPTDGSVWQGDGALRVLRGGSWSLGSQFARATKRVWDKPAAHSNNRGFRLARMLP
jgi:formylglycine-generating enzyme required for sulfatase activity